MFKRVIWSLHKNYKNDDLDYGNLEGIIGKTKRKKKEKG